LLGASENYFHQSSDISIKGIGWSLEIGSFAQQCAFAEKLATVDVRQTSNISVQAGDN
jgi:hypothetical protein